jgi:hypothetical protein
MLTKPRLRLFEAQTLGQKMKVGMFQKMFGMVPAALAVTLPETKLDRSAFTKSKLTIMRVRSAWGIGERELLSAFVSYLNHCRF